eukprot:GILJ01000242.1.p1 GENE.GILJ01000242.1~~GILJ01000242.1.p1  ORF type:complete len:222 (+),score=16.76 GILJ01000242.1:247-912(+)
MTSLAPTPTPFPIANAHLAYKEYPAPPLWNPIDSNFKYPKAPKRAHKRCQSTDSMTSRTSDQADDASTCSGSSGSEHSDEQKHSDFVVKFKTELCKNFIKTGVCRFGKKCAFAHGEHEMRPKKHVSTKYKTQPCNQFHNNGFCPYGIRCQFVHDTRKLSDIPAPVHQLLASFPQEFWTIRQSRPRLEVFKRLSECDDIDAQDEEEHDAQSQAVAAIVAGFL